MQSTLNLLERAIAQHPAPYWSERLKLSRNTLATAKLRGHLSPAIAGALAQEMGEDPKEWIVIAALESERESACKARMVRSLMGRAAAAFVVGAVGAVGLLGGPSPAMASAYNQIASSSLYLMSNRGRRMIRAMMAALAHVSRTLPGATAAL